jgi:hypothetical protein
VWISTGSDFGLTESSSFVPDVVVLLFNLFLVQSASAIAVHQCCGHSLDEVVGSYFIFLVNQFDRCADIFLHSSSFYLFVNSTPNGHFENIICLQE